MTGEAQEGLFDSRSDVGEAGCAVVSKRNRKSSAQARTATAQFNRGGLTTGQERANYLPAECHWTR